MAFRIDQLAVLNLATVGNSVTAGSFVKSGGTSSQFLKADGSVDSTSYVTGGPYLALSGGTMTGNVQFNANTLQFNNNGVRSWSMAISGGNLSISSGDGAGSLLYNSRPLRDSYYRTYSGFSDYYSGGTAGWYRVAEITLTGNCSGAVIYGTLYDNRYDGADTYQIAVVARAECDFTSNNESHYINVGCTILGSTNYTSYQSKIRVVLSASSAGSRTYELQFYESPWNHDTWQLESTGWTIYTSPQAPRAAVGTARVNYVSNQNADYIRANTAVYSPIYYDSSDTQYYLNGNTSGGWRVGTPTGYLDFGSLNADYCHFQTDRTKFYFNKRVEVDGELWRYNGSRFVENTGTWGISITGNAATATNASTVTNGVYTNTNNSLTLGNRIVIQNSQDGGNTRGIFMWNSGDANWGIYMAQAGAGKALSDGTAPAGIDGRTEHAIRFRVAASTTQIGFLWENSDNNSLMQLQPNTGNLYTRGQIYAGNSTSNLVLHSGNYTSYAPSLTGTNASGTWAISISGNAATASSASSATNSTNALRIVYADGPRNLSDRLPNSFTRTVNWDFVTSGTVGGTGNYAGVMTWSPWTGTTASTGDSSYQLAFMNGTGQDGTGLPALRLRKGIDTTWGSWYTILNDGNYTNYAPNINGGSTINGITYFSNGESINLYGIRGRFTNEYMHLYNKVGIGHPSGWGQGEGNTPNQGLSTYGGINVAYGTNAASTFNGSIVYAAGIGDTGYRRFQDPGGGSYTTQTSVITGAIRIKMPTQGSAMMITCTVKVYEYTTNKSFTITFGGHRDSNNWYNEFCYLDGADARGELTVRFGVDGGKDCVYIGETNTSWSYPQVFVTDFQMGYTGYSASWLSGWEVGFVTSFATVNRTQTAYRKLTPANYSSYALPVSGGTLGGSLTINGSLTVGNSTSSDIYMTDTDENTRRQHCNSSRIGFLSTSNTWGSYCGTDGSWYSDQSMRAPIFYDSQDTFYYVDPNGTSRVSRFQPLNLGGATLQFRSTDLAVDSGSREAITFIDGSQVQAHVSTGTGCGGCCYNWWSSESIQVDAEKDYEFHVWVRSTGNDNVYLGWWEGDTSGSTITSNPYFHTGNINTGGTWVKLTAKLKNWRTASGQANTSGQDRYASTSNMSNDLTGTIDGVMHSNTRFVHIRLGTCYGTVAGSKTYFYGAQIREAGYDDYQQNFVIPYYNGSSWGGKLRFGYNDWGYFGIGMYGAAGEFRMSSDSGDLNLRVDGWIRTENHFSTAGPIKRTAHVAGWLEGSYNNVGANDGKSNPIYTIGSSYNPGETTLSNMYGIGYAHPNFWGSGKVAGWGMYVANNGTIDACIGGDSTSSVGIWCRLDIVAYSDARVKENVEVIENAVEKVKGIRGVTFTRNDIDDRTKRHAGVIAQEVLAVMPELVTGDDESRYSVAYGNMAGLLIEAIKEQQKQIEELKAKLDGLTK